jgi:hypothetical protein
MLDKIHQQIELTTKRNSEETKMNLRVIKLPIRKMI